ncbi:MAG: flavodoxin family protein [Desulfohalobiaceae bacterium]|nr:flavodoxin family protein [Desulfohalobiaceae bacterium]
MSQEANPKEKKERMSLLGLVCSTRRLGNSELLIKEVSSRLTTPHQLNLLRLPQFDIRPCKACYACLEEGRCRQEDDLATVLDALCQADALIVATPTYFLGPQASLKTLLDRGLSFYGRADTLWGKPAVGAAVAGIPGKEGYAKLGMESFLKFLLAEIRASGVFYGALPGEIFQEEDNLNRMEELAAALEGRRSEPSGFCPVCGGDTFRFLSSSRIRCMLCSNEGEAEGTANGISIDVRPEEHQMFTNQKTALDHADWLRGMKDRFRAKKRELLSLTGEYKDMGNWIQPE